MNFSGEVEAFSIKSCSLIFGDVIEEYGIALEKIEVFFRIRCQKSSIFYFETHDIKNMN